MKSMAEQLSTKLGHQDRGKEIPIEQKKSTIKYKFAAGKLNIFVNGEQVHDE